ncbi:MAG: TraB/GumN family protein, partial [Bacteroidota bacterium]
FNNTDTTNTLKSTLSENAYADINRLLLERAGQTIEELKNKSPQLIRMMLREKEKDRPDNKDVFLDLYLYRMARRQGKQTHGLERIEDHQNLDQLFFNEFENETSDSIVQTLQLDTLDLLQMKEVVMNPLELLTTLYLTGDLEAIDDLVNAGVYENAFRYELIVKRNKVMADNIEKLIRQQSTFSAVGTAHLPGKEGVIELLRARGYTMRPVTAVWSGLVDNYQPVEKELVWQPYRNDFFLYDAIFPGKAYNWKWTPEEGSSLTNHYTLYNDLVENTRYHIKVALISEWDQTIKKQGYSNYLKERVKNWLLRDKGDRLEFSKPIELNGHPGLEFLVAKSDEEFIRGRAYYAHQHIYYVWVKQGDQILNSKDINRFFAGFQLDDPRPLVWKTFHDEVGAWSANLPTEPMYKLNVVPVEMEEGEMANYRLNIFASKDIEAGIHCYVRYHNFPNGYYNQNDSITLSQMTSELLDRFEPTVK